MSFGVAVIATGYKGFGIMAQNLLASIKALMPGIEVCLIRDENILNPIGFDHVVTVPNQNAFHLKTKIYNLTPFKNTLYIDADSLLINDLLPFLQSIEGTPIQFMEYRRYKKGDTGKMVWATVDELFRAYDLKDESILPEYNSSVFYFEKCKETKRFFQVAERSYNADVHLKEKVRRKFPDEVAFSAASAITGTLSKVEYWQPAFLEWIGQKGISVKDILNKYQVVTMSGKAQPGNNIGHVYNGLGTKFSKQTGLPFTIWTTRLKPS